MKIRSLGNTSFDLIFETFNRTFAAYDTREQNSVKISDMPNEIRSVSIGAFDMIADFWDLGECYCWKTFF